MNHIFESFPTIIWLCALLTFNTWSHASELKILSYNIYFDDQSGQLRYPQIIAHLKTSKADIIALQ